MRERKEERERELEMNRETNFQIPINNQSDRQPCLILSYFVLTIQLFLGRINEGSAGIGSVSVFRSDSDSQRGYSWTVSFTSAVGNIDQLTAKSSLNGLKSAVSVRTMQDGNEIGGTFSISFQNNSVENIPHNITAEELKIILFSLPTVVSAYVHRNNPTNNCNDGLCSDGPSPSGGLKWSAYVTTNSTYGDTTPYYPSQVRSIHFL